MNHLKEKLKQLIRKELEEMSATSGGEAYSTPFAFTSKKQNKNKATKYAEKEGWKVAKKPTTSKVVDYKKIFEMKSNLNETTGAVSGKESRRFIPKGFELPEKIFKPYKLTIKVEVEDKEKKGEKKIEEKVEERIFFKIATGKDTGESILLIDDLARIALGAIERGRTSFEKEKRLPEVTRILKDILPGPVKSIIKKATTGVKQLSNGYVPVPVKITKKDITGYGSSTKSSSIKITDRGINLLKKIKENPSNYEALGGDFIQFLVSLYKNKDNASITPGELANQIGISPIAASRFANDMAKNNIADLGKSTEQPKNTDKWYIYNPGAPSEEPLDVKGVGTKLYESIVKDIVKEELLNEVTYSKFKNEVKFRTKSEQLHKAIREVKRKLQEIDRIVEYTSRMKQELSEDGGLNYWKATQKNIGTISEMVNQLNNKIKNLHQ